MISNRANGFVFSTDATFSLIVITAIVALAFYMLSSLKLHEIDELLVLQQEHDLMKHWLLQRPSHQEMIAQAQKMFGKNFSIEADGQFFGSKGNGLGNSISSRLLVIDKDLKVQEIVIKVYQ